MENEVITAADLVRAWQETTRAAELTDRLAWLAADASDHAGDPESAGVDIAALAETAATAAERAAQSAPPVVDRARSHPGPDEGG